MIISSEEWENVVAVVPVRLPVIVADSVNSEVEDFVDDYQPDNIYTLGFDAGLNNSYRIEPGDVPALFFPNETRAVYADSREGAVLGSQLAYYMGIPLVLDPAGWDPEELIDLTGLEVEEIRNMYLAELLDNGDNTDYLVLTNTESESFLLAGRVAGFRQGYIVPVSLIDIGYSGEPSQVNSDNGVATVIAEVNTTADILRWMGLFSGSSGYRKGEPLYLAILGDEYSIPYVAFYDPGLEIFFDKDGGVLFTDQPYSDLNGDNFMDLATGRFSGNLTSISLQLERMQLPKNDEAVLIGQYRHRKYEDFMLLGGGMMQAYVAQWSLDAAGLDTRRIIENRTSPPLNIGLKGMFEMASHRYGLYKSSIGSSASVVTWVWAILELSTEAMYNLLEHDWEEWLENAKQGSIGLPKRLEVFYPDTELGEPRILGYFGVGDEHWMVPPDDKDEIELITVPYIRATPFTTLDFSNFLYDDHDMSAMSWMEEQVISSGGMAASSSGIVHDPQTIFFSTTFFHELYTGKPTGEAMKEAVNSIVPKDTLRLAYLLSKPLDKPNLYFKAKYERLLLGDPAYKPVEGLPEEGDAFGIKPHNSFLATSSIDSDYIIKSNRLHVYNADDYLAETGKPLIPVFVREFMLPGGSSLEDVSFRGFYRTYRHLEKQVIPWDEHYPEGDGFSGDYPEEKYWYSTAEMLDGRILVKVYMPAVLHDERRSRVLRYGWLSIEYESPLEVVVETRDIRLGLTEEIEVELHNQGDEAVSGVLWVWVGEEELSREVDVEPGDVVEELFYFTPEQAGDYQVKVLFDSEGFSSGMRYSDFRVWERCALGCNRFPFWFRWMFRVGCGSGCCNHADWAWGSKLF